MYCIKEKVSLSVVMERVVHDIIGRDVHGDYAICLGCDKPIQWIESKYLKGYLDLDLLIKKQAFNASAMVSHVIICHYDNININLYNKFCELYMEDTRNKKSPLWDGRWFYQGRVMRVMDKLLCHAKMHDNKVYYLVEWGNRFKMKPSWIEHQELSFYIKENCTAWQQFDASWDVISNCKMCPNKIKQMELERSMFLGRSGGRDDIDRFLLDEGYSPMPTYDSDGHFCEDDASAKLDEDDEGDADIDSYN